jgi:hypothetical protein
MQTNQRARHKDLPCPNDSNVFWLNLPQSIPKVLEGRRVFTINGNFYQGKCENGIYFTTYRIFLVLLGSIKPLFTYKSKIHLLITACFGILIVFSEILL